MEAKAGLQVKSLGLIFLLGLHDTFSGRSEICHLYTHTAFTKSHETCLRTYGFDICTREIVLLSDEFIKFDVFA